MKGRVFLRPYIGNYSKNLSKEKIILEKSAWVFTFVGLPLRAGGGRLGIALEIVEERNSGFSCLALQKKLIPENDNTRLLVKSPF
jgi:hypothetical protein